MEHIKEIRTYNTFNKLYQDFIKSTNYIHSDRIKSIIHNEVMQKALIKENNIKI